MVRNKDCKYDRQSVKSGILHFGVGNFHRAHQEYYVNRLLEENPDCRDWGICGAMILPSDEKLYRALKSQKREYTLTICGRTGRNETLRIGSLTELYWAGDSKRTIIDKIADRAIRIITLTITEGGYNISKVDGEFLMDDEYVQHDLACPADPLTVFGYVAEGLRRRKAAGNGPLTILSCDNLQHNGDTARKAFTSFIAAQDADLSDWVSGNVTFPNCMVDRITPAVHQFDIERLNAENGTRDKAPVYCEDFIQWVIEDKFAAGRPPLEKVGVQFTDDVSSWENMKLSLLNASHTMLSYPAFLSGYRKVDDAMRDESIVALLKTFMETDITPYVPAPDGVDLAMYKQTLIERFGNRAVSDQIARLCSDGISKFPVYIVPNLKKMIADGADMTRMAYLAACYRQYLKYRRDDNGETFDIWEPWLTNEDEELISDDDPMAFLTISPFAGAGLDTAEKFADPYMEMVGKVHDAGAMRTLKDILK